jgi:hypothetical protein
MAGMVANGGSKMEGRTKRDETKKERALINIGDVTPKLACLLFRENLDPLKAYAFNRFLAP